MSKARVLTAIIAFALAAPAALTAQERRMGGGPDGSPPYDPKVEQIVSGRIVGTDTLEPPNRAPVMYLTITAANGPLNVILGPADWVKKQAFAFPAGTAAEVTGMPGFRLNGAAVLARSVKVGAKTLTLRDKDGKPKWEGS